MRERSSIINKHPVQMTTEGGLLSLSGYETIDPQSCECFTCYGNHFLNYGITDHSLIVTSKTAPISDGDLVIKFDDGKPVVYFYTREKKNAQEGMPSLHSKKDIYAKILVSFNLFE